MQVRTLAPECPPIAPDLHILKGDVPTCDKVRPAITAFKPLERAERGS